jgi:hypothetical protein
MRVLLLTLVLAIFWCGTARPNIAEKKEAAEKKALSAREEVNIRLFLFNITKIKIGKERKSSIILSIIQHSSSFILQPCREWSMKIRQDFHLFNQFSINFEDTVTAKIFW